MTGFFAEDEAPDLRHIRSEILRYRTTDLMNDRERAAFFGLPQGCRMREGAKIIHPEKFTCGTHVWIGENAILDAQGGLSVGDNSVIASHVMVWTHTTHRQAVAGQTSQDKSLIRYEPTSIGANTFIGGPSVIGLGVTIGDGVIVSPMSFVEEDLADGTVYSNNRRRDDLEQRVAALEAEIAALRDD
jgi:acetyltransferase-like isoleucine patch superfamily enzyme